MLLQIIFIIIGLALLLWGGDFFVKAACRIANKLQISPLVIGLTIVAFGTSAPELFVTAGAAIKGNADFSIGNIIGSNIFNIFCVIGISALLTTIPINRQVRKFEMPIMLLALVLFYVFSLNLNISHLEGGILFAGIISYLIWIYLSSKHNKSSLLDEELPDAKWSVPISFLIIIGALVAMIAGANLIIDNATIFAKSLGISDFVISVTLAAVGTSLPELATTLSAIKQKQTDLIVGNAVGSNIFNVFSVLGITALCKPLNVLESAINFDYLVMIIGCCLIWVVMLWRKKFTKIEGSLMLLAYAAYVFFLVKNGGIS